MAGFPESERAALRAAARLPWPAQASDADEAPVADARVWQLRLALVGGVLAALVSAVLVARLAPSHTADADLNRLIAAMGWIKGGIVACAAAILVVRFRWPISPVAAIGYVLAVAAATFGAAMIAQTAFVAASALAFHLAALSAIALAGVEGRRSLASLRR
jgi:hypothetical protein